MPNLSMPNPVFSVMMQPITFGPQACGSLTDEGGARREWLVTDGLGRLRHRHGVWPAHAPLPCTARRGRSGVVAPQGHRRLETFTLVDGLPRWRWRVGDVVVERALARLRALGVVRSLLIAPDDTARAAIGANILDPRRRGPTLAAGVAQAATVTAAVAQIWAG
jgi:hypothetical protein